MESYFGAAEERLPGMRAGTAWRLSSSGQEKRLKAQVFLYVGKVDSWVGAAGKVDFRNPLRQETPTLLRNNFLAVAGVRQVLRAVISEDGCS